MTEISSDNEGPYPSDSAPIEGTHVTDASSTTSTKDALAQISSAMLQLTTEMSQLRQQQQHTQQPGIPHMYQPHVQSYGIPMTHNPHFHHHSYPPVPQVRSSSSLPDYKRIPRNRTIRDPQKEKSKKAFYGVRNGLQGNAVYSSWPDCATDVYDIHTQSYRPGTLFRGFDSYTLAYLYSLGVDDPIAELQTNPSVISNLHSTPEEPTFHSHHSHTPNGDDTFLSDVLDRDKIPSDVSYSQVSQVSTSSDFHSSIMKERNLPKYTGSEDLSIFLHKLKPLLDRPEISNCHLDEKTTIGNAQCSANLATLLWVCLDGDALSPFVNNDTFIDKGIEMIHTLRFNAYPTSRSAANAIMANLHTIKISQDETFEQFGKRLRTLYATSFGMVTTMTLSFCHVVF